MERNDPSYLGLYTNLESIASGLEDHLERLRDELDLLYFKMSDEDRFYLNQRKMRRDDNE